MTDDTTDHSDQEQSEFDEVAAKMGEARRGILAVLRHSPGPKNSREIRLSADVPVGSMHHHMTTLEDWGMVEDVGEEMTAAGGSVATVWELTDKGREYLAADVSESVPRLGELQSRLDELESAVSENSEEIAEIRETVDTLVDVVQGLEDYVVPDDE